MDMKILLEKLDMAVSTPANEAVEATADDSQPTEDFKIKLSVGFERLAGLLFLEQDMKVGRIALRKVLLGKQDILNLRERNVMANAIVHLLPTIAGDRTVFSRIERKLDQMNAAPEEK